MTRSSREFPNSTDPEWAFSHDHVADDLCKRGGGVIVVELVDVGAGLLRFLAVALMRAVAAVHRVREDLATR